MWHLNDDGYVERMRKSYTYCQIEAEDLLHRGRKVGAMGLLLNPLKIFLIKYFLQQGFRDGLIGLLSALHCADATFRTYALAWDAQNKISRQTLEAECRQKWQTAGAPTSAENGAIASFGSSSNSLLSQPALNSPL